MMEFCWTICVFVITVGTLAAGQQIGILPTGTSINKATKGSVMFTCTINSADSKTQVQNQKWFDSAEKEITSGSDRVYIEKEDEQTLKLFITNIQESDAGTYTCVGTVEGNELRKTVQLELFKGITYDNAPLTQNPVEYTDALVICRVSGRPTPTVSWKYRGDKIHTGGRYVIDPLEGLKIFNVTEEDNGLYSCRAEVSADGRVGSRDITVVVHKKPKMIKELGENKGVEGQQVAIECKASGIPDPQYEYFRVDETTNEEVPVSDIAGKRKIGIHAGDLTFNSLYRDDQAEYICRAINTAGSVDSRGKLEVQIPPKIYDYRNLTQEEGKNKKLTCLSEGAPAPEMNFHKVGNAKPYELGVNENGRIIVEKASGRLEMTINNLVPEDSSNYTCNSRNEAGFAEQNGTLIVQYSPRFKQGQKTEFYGWAGKTRNMTCMTYAEPAPVIEWFHFGRLLETNETYRIIPLIKNSVLQIKVMQAEEIWIFNEYTCRARNDYGSNELLMTFKRAMQPNPPNTVEVVDESPTRIVLKATPPVDDGGMPLIGYRVEFESVVNSYLIVHGRKVLRMVDSKGDTMVIDNLRPSTTYVFNVRAENEVDVSTPHQIDYKTKAISKPYPLDISSHKEGLSPYEYTLSWQKPETGGNSIKEYKFFVRKVQVDPDTKKVIKPLEEWNTRIADDSDRENPMQSYKLVGLKPNTWYQVQAEARNDINWSDKSSMFLFKTTPELERPVIDVGSQFGPSQGLLYFLVLLLLLCHKM